VAEVEGAPLVVSAVLLLRDSKELELLIIELKELEILWLGVFGELAGGEGVIETLDVWEVEVVIEAVNDIEGVND